MQGSSALLITGTVVLVAGLAGPSIAADDPAENSAPAAEVAEAGEEAPAVPQVPVEEVQAPATPTEDGGDTGRNEPALEVAELGGGGSGEKGDRVRGSQRQDDGVSEKDPRKGVSVTIKDFEYKPDSIEVSPGDEITWTNKDTAQHTATAEGKGDFDTGLLEKGQKGTVPFNATGTFAYICTVHPDMKGDVVVRSSGSGGSGDTGGTSADTNTTTDSTFPTTSSSDFGSTPSTSSSGGSLPNTGQNELPLLLLGTGLIVIGLLARAFREYWIWR